MGTKLSRSDFRRQYPAVYQGLFVFYVAKRIPKEQPTINLGYELSMRLLNVPAERRCFETETCLRTIVDEYRTVTLTHIEVLFTPPQAGYHRCAAGAMQESEGMYLLARGYQRQYVNLCRTWQP